MDIGVSRQGAAMTTQGWLQAALPPRAAGAARPGNAPRGTFAGAVSRSDARDADAIQRNALDSAHFSGRAGVGPLGVPVVEEGGSAFGYGPDGKARAGLGGKSSGVPLLHLKRVSVPHKEGELPSPGMAPDSLSSAQDEKGTTAALRGVDDEALADERMLAKLRTRDQQVKAREKAQGEAVNGEAYMYQIGPDGKRYAIGTRLHMVRRDGDRGTGATAPMGSTPLPGGGKALSSTEQQDLERLQARDQEVRGHERAHLAASGGQAVGSPHYEYQTGPDGRRYAVGGSVALELKSVSGDPQSARRDAEMVRRAALAPGTPSGQDYVVAARAGQVKALAARQEAGQFSGAALNGHPRVQEGGNLSRRLAAYREEKEKPSLLATV